MAFRRIFPVALLCSVIAGTAAGMEPDHGPGYRDPLDAPSVMTRRATNALMLAVARAGSRLVAVGELGRILLSDDDGQSWRQVPVPVSVNLVAVHFPTPRDGWAVGHGGIVLHSGDGGESWTRQLDGRSAMALLRDHYARLRDAGDRGAERYLKAVELNYQNGPELPMLGVWFRDAGEGFVVGAFGTVLRTGDGGRSWTPWLDRIDQDGDPHLMAVTAVGGRVFVTGETGRVWRLNEAAGRFEATQTPYAGTLFGIAGRGDRVIAFGLRGHAVSSDDGGEHWSEVPLPDLSDSINAAAPLGDGRLVLVTQGGRLLVERAGGAGFATQEAARPTLLTGIAPVGQDAVVLTGLSGVMRQKIAGDRIQ